MAEPNVGLCEKQKHGRRIVVLEKIQFSDKTTNEEVFEHIGENKTLFNNILRRKANWICHILRRNYLLHDDIEGQITKVTGAGTHLHDDLRNRRKLLGTKTGI